MPPGDLFLTQSRSHVPSVKRWVLIFFAVLTLSAPAAHSDELVIAAAASLTDVLREIGKLHGSRSHNKITFSFGASSILARQILEGAPVDFFFSADLEKLGWLDRNGQIEPGTTKKLLSNRLVMVVPKNSAMSIGSPADLLRPDVIKIALAEPSTVPAGIYAREFLEGEGIWERISSKIVPVANVRATLATVGWGNVDVGIVYRTDAAISDEVKIVYEVPGEKGPDITYLAALVKDSKNIKTAHDLLEFVSGDDARKIFETYGFIFLQ